MRKLMVLFALLLVVPAFAGKQKFKNKKQKSFEPVVAAASQYAGSYRGPSERHSLELESTGGVLRGTYREEGRVASVEQVSLIGAELTAAARFDDGGFRILNITFANRVLNGERAFGLRMKDVHVGGMDQPINTFFEKR
jgi:hypothetical protein